MRAIVYAFDKRIISKSLMMLATILLCNYSYSQLYSNGNLSTGTVSKSGITSPTGYTWSEVQNDTGNTTEANKNTGYAGYFNTAGTTSFQLGDNFTVPVGEQWNITSFDFYIHQNSYTGPTIPVNQLRIQIWDGDPSLPSSVVVFGDMTTNVLDALGGGNTFTYRIPNSIIGVTVIPPNTNRKIWKIRGNCSVILNPKNYWVVYQFHATNDASIFIPTVTVSGVRGLAAWNAKQNFVANTTPGQVLGWTNIIDIGDPATAPDVSQDLPFDINGSITNLGTNQNDFSSSIVLYPNPVKNFISISIPNVVKIDEIEIYDLLGRNVKKFSNVDSSLNISSLASGSYILKIKSGTSVAVKKIIKE